MRRIPFNRPYLAGNEFDLMRDSLESGKISGDGEFTRRCCEFLEREIGCERALLTTSCTHALEMAALLLDIGPGDEVIVPSFTFVSTINAFVLRGAKPIFADIRPDTLNIDEALLPSLITDKTRAIVVVHYAGVGCEMAEIAALADSHGIAIVEDNAHGLFGRYHGRMLGTFGCMATQSFHETKNFSCGEGGALLINDAALESRAEIIWEKGTNRRRFFRGQVDKYTWVDVGSSYLPSDLLAAFLLAQLESKDDIQRKRRLIWNTYHGALPEWAAGTGIRLPHVPDGSQQAYHMYYMLMPSLDARQRLIAHLGQRGVKAVFHYLPLNCSEMGQRFGGRIGDCPVAEDVSDRLIRLPFYNGLSEEDQQRVVTAIKEFGT